MFRKRQFPYDAARDVYVCPNQQLLIYGTTNREGYRQYHSDAQQCRQCPLRQQCTRSRNATTIVTRHVWRESRERADDHHLAPHGRRNYQRRKETVERSYADAKQLHGHRYARMRGLMRAAEQCLLAAAAQNIKKIALLLSCMKSNRDPNRPDPAHKQLQQQLRTALRNLLLDTGTQSQPHPVNSEPHQKRWGSSAVWGTAYAVPVVLCPNDVGGAVIAEAVAGPRFRSSC